MNSSHQPTQRLSFPLSLGAALLVTLCIFVSMYRLIHSDARQDRFLEDVSVVDIIEPPEPENIEEKLTEPEPLPEEPTLDDLHVDMPSPTAPTQTEMPTAELSVGDISVKASGNFVPPAVGAGASGDMDQGKGNSGFRTVLPAATRQPNIPQMAWENKIDGWVLATFVVYNDGRVDKVRILDSYPRGVFEEQVICAINGWRYYVFDGPPRQLTQKIELFWKDFPNNIQQQVCR